MDLLKYYDWAAARRRDEERRRRLIIRKKRKKRNRAANKKWSTVSEVPPISHADTFQFCLGFLTHFCRPLYVAFACAFFVQDGLQREESQQHSQKQNKKKWTKERREGNQSATPFFLQARTRFLSLARFFRLIIYCRPIPIKSRTTLRSFIVLRS